jgi:inosose dehydratase
VDFPSIKKELENLGFEGWIVVEQDVLPGMGKPKDSAKRNREYLKSIGYK